MHQAGAILHQRYHHIMFTGVQPCIHLPVICEHNDPFSFSYGWAMISYTCWVAWWRLVLSIFVPTKLTMCVTLHHTRHSIPSQRHCPDGHEEGEWGIGCLQPSRAHDIPFFPYLKQTHSIYVPHALSGSNLTCLGKSDSFVSTRVLIVVTRYPSTAPTFVSQSRCNRRKRI